MFTPVNAIFWHVVQDYDGKKLLHAKSILSDGELPANYYTRLPANSVNTTRPSIWILQQQPAGMFVQFQTNASSIHVNYTLGSKNLGMWHFAPTGVSGMDAYSWDETNVTWRWTGTSHPAYPTTVSTMATLRCVAPNCPMRTYRIHLCTYNTISNDFSIGVSSSHDIFVPDDSHFQALNKASILWYGSSILQGAVASRPGQIMTHQVSRTLETLIYNFGFSGNCLMETTVAQYLVQVVPPPTLIIIDCNPNMNWTLIQERAKPLIKFIRASPEHLETPIIMTEGTKHGTDWSSVTSRIGRYNKTVVLKKAFDELVADGDNHLYYSTSKDIYSASLGMKPSISGNRAHFVDPTVGGTHPTDLGMRKQAMYWETKIPQVLVEDAKRVSRVSKSKSKSKRQSKKKHVSSDKMFEHAVDHLHGGSMATVTEEAKEEKEKEKEEKMEDTFLPSLFLPSLFPPISSPASSAALSSAVDWTDGAALLRGFATFNDVNATNRNSLPRISPYDRLPSKAMSDVRPAVWSLSKMSTGMYLRFTTNATEIFINHTLAFPSQELWHMPLSGTDGLDVYAWSTEDKYWRHLPVTTGIELFPGNNQVNVSGVFSRPEPVTMNMETTTKNAPWTYLLYLPLRNAPKNIRVGVSSKYLLCSGGRAVPSPSTATASTPSTSCKGVDTAPRFDDKYKKPIVWYGTSIQQGGVASRAGNEYDAIISRALSVEIYNFGFAGNGVMELSVAKYLAMTEASVLMIDCLPNMNAAMVLNRT